MFIRNDGKVKASRVSDGTGLRMFCKKKGRIAWYGKIDGYSIGLCEHDEWWRQTNQRYGNRLIPSLIAAENPFYEAGYIHMSFSLDIDDNGVPFERKAWGLRCSLKHSAPEHIREISRSTMPFRTGWLLINTFGYQITKRKNGQLIVWCPECIREYESFCRRSQELFDSLRIPGPTQTHELMQTCDVVDGVNVVKGERELVK